MLMCFLSMMAHLTEQSSRLKGLLKPIHGFIFCREAASLESAPHTEMAYYGPTQIASIALSQWTAI